MSLQFDYLDLSNCPLEDLSEIKMLQVHELYIKAAQSKPENLSAFMHIPKLTLPIAWQDLNDKQSLPSTTQITWAAL